MYRLARPTSRRHTACSRIQPRTTRVVPAHRTIAVSHTTAPMVSWKRLLQTVPSSKDTIVLTDSAVERLKELKEEDKRTKLRLIVEGGGCNGFKLRFELDENPAKKDDILITKDGAEVVIDDVSIDYVRGATIDYKSEIARSAFEMIDNPRATTKCGCNVSFSID